MTQIAIYVSSGLQHVLPYISLLIDVIVIYVFWGGGRGATGAGDTKSGSPRTEGATGRVTPPQRGVATLGIVRVGRGRGRRQGRAG
jgi:hypothetical protein